jgi:hypothetical protein
MKPNYIKSFIIRFIYHFSFNLLKFKWLFEYFIYLKNSKTKHIYLETETYDILTKNLLILIPHSDDELIGCYQLISKNKENVKCYYLGFTGTNPIAENKITRLDELKKLSEILNFDLIISEGNYVAELNSIFASFKPEIIGVPSIIDWHRDHLQTNMLLQEVLNVNKINYKILQYQLSVPMPEESITHYNLMTRQEQKSKWNLFRTVYRSQRNIPVFRFILHEKLAGRFFGYHAAEVYKIYDNMNEWICHLEMVKTKPLSEELSLLSFRINDINEIRSESQRVFELFSSSKNNL